MGIGLPELLIVLVTVGGWAVGLVDAARKQRIGWVVAMSVTGLFATIAYLLIRPGPRAPVRAA